MKILNFIVLSLLIILRSSSQVPANELVEAALFGDTDKVKTLLESKKYTANEKDLNDTTALMWAARDGRTETVELLLNAGADVNAAKDNWGGTALIYAVKYGRIDITKLLLSKGATDINEAFVYACGGEAEEDVQLEIANLLLDAGADVDAKDKKDRTAVVWAAGKGYNKILELLISKGADVNAANFQGTTALMRAAGAGNINSVMLLLEKGAKINTKNKSGETALSLAAKFGRFEAVKLLVSKKAKNLNEALTAAAGGYQKESALLEIVNFLLLKGANVNGKDQFGMTALMAAASKGHTQVVQFLLEMDAKINEKNQHGITALMRAVQARQIETVKLLLEKKANVNINEKGITALYLATMRTKYENDVPEMVQLLLEKGADIDSDKGLREWVVSYASNLGYIPILKFMLKKGFHIDENLGDGNTALMATAQWGHYEAVKFLLEHGADVNKSGKNGTTALRLAAGSGHLQIVQALLEKGAQNVHEALISVAGGYGSETSAQDTENVRVQVVELLLQSGADINHKDEHGYTVLMNSSNTCNQTNLVDFFLQRDAKINAPTDQGNTALMIAAMNGCTNNVKLLLSHGADPKLKDIFGFIALDFAKRNNYKEIISLLETQ